MRRYFATTKPLTAKGKLALARALIDAGRSRHRAAASCATPGVPMRSRPTWKQQILDGFAPLLTGGDHKARMDRRIYADDTAAALRAAQKLGPAQVAIVKAAEAVIDKSSKAKALLDAVPAEVRNDTAYLFTRAQWLRRNDKIDDAAKAMLAAQITPAAVQDPDEWWSERRLLARKLLDLGDAQTAFRIARDAAPPEKEGGRVEQLFTAGWIAFRFLNNPAEAKPLFARCAQVAEHPASFSRAYYWQARTAEALGQNAEARSLYERAARSSTTYYGQMAHARLGGAELRLPRAAGTASAGRPARDRARDGHALRRSTSAIWSPPPLPISPIAQSIRRHLRRSPRLPNARAMPARSRCSAAPRSAAACRSNITPIRSPDCRGSSRSASRMSSRMSPTRSRGRKAASIRAPYPAPRRKA